MQTQSEPTASHLTTLVREAAGRLQRASGADMVAVYLFDAESRSFYAPVALGQAEDALYDSLADMAEQLARYDQDAAQGKAPQDLRVTQYGLTAWLIATRRPMVAVDAPAEIDSTFIRRFRVESAVGLPLLSREQQVGIAYLNYTAAPGADPARPSRVPEGEAFERLLKVAEEVAETIYEALVRADRTALASLVRLAAQLSLPGADEANDAAAFRRRISIALADLLLASDLDAAAVYQLTGQRGRLELVSANLPGAAPAEVELPDDVAEAEAALGRAVGAAARRSNLHAVQTLELESGGDVQGYMVLLSRDHLASARKAPGTDLLLRTASGLIGGALANQRLFATLDHGNRLLGALGRMSNAMLRPGASRQQVLDAVARHLTDAAVPEFDFQFATVYLLGESHQGRLAVEMAGGATTSPTIDSAEMKEGSATALVPRWALDQERALSPQDVLVFVARSWEAAVVGALSQRGDDAGDELLPGAGGERMRRTQVPVVLEDGRTVASIPVVTVAQARPGDSRLPLVATDPPFTLAGELFQASGHGDLYRIFVPFGLDDTKPATGVLEVGYHRSVERRPDLTQVGALRAAASNIAVAAETARLYESVRTHAEQLELGVDVATAIASSIDLEQTLRLVARNLARLVGASVCQIALYEEDGSGWFGAAASDQEEQWRKQHGDRPADDFLFDLQERGHPLVIEDTAASSLVDADYAERFGVRSLLALPLLVDGEPIGAAVLGQREQTRTFTADEVQLAQGLAVQAAVAIKNARLHALVEEERHIQKDFVLVGFGMWGQKAYHHLLTLKQFFNFRIHVVERDSDQPDQEAVLAAKESEVRGHGDAFYRDRPDNPAHEQLKREMESSCYVITYVATPAITHLPTVARYYDLSDVILIEKPLGAPPEAYRRFIDAAPGGVQIVAADHYYFKLEVRLLQLLLTEERTLRDFLESVDEIRIEILEEKPLVGAAADIGVIADLVPHAFAIVSLLTPIDRIKPAEERLLQIGRHEGLEGAHESYARLNATFPYQGRPVRLVIDVGKGVEDAKWIKLVGEHRVTGRSAFYKFDFGRGDAIDGTQTNVRAATRRIREPGVPDNAHLTMLRHVLEKRRPAVGILSIREAIRSNQRIQELEAMAADLLATGEVTTYRLGSRPGFAIAGTTPVPVVEVEPAPVEEAAVPHPAMPDAAVRS
ncbi:MAG: GAF domain-containing protein [Candidatus Dormibacteraeota bacterium]|nr:GAF domain-containing protein [Candidatus Dormibacteraeota bacterium]